MGVYWILKHFPIFLNNKSAPGMTKRKCIAMVSIRSCPNKLANGLLVRKRNFSKVINNNKSAKLFIYDCEKNTEKGVRRSDLWTPMIVNAKWFHQKKCFWIWCIASINHQQWFFVLRFFVPNICCLGILFVSKICWLEIFLQNWCLGYFPISK